MGYSFRLAASVLYMHYPTCRITHTTAIAIPVVEHWLDREIVQSVHDEGLIRRPIAPLQKLRTHSTYFNGYVVKDRSDSWRHFTGFSFRSAPRRLSYTPSHRQDNTARPVLHQLEREIFQWVHYEGSIYYGATFRSHRQDDIHITAFIKQVHFNWWRKTFKWSS